VLEDLDCSDGVDFDLERDDFDVLHEDFDFRPWLHALQFSRTSRDFSVKRARFGYVSLLVSIDSLRYLIRVSDIFPTRCKVLRSFFWLSRALRS
jgi:hypothetical protein